MKRYLAKRLSVTVLVVVLIVVGAGLAPALSQPSEPDETTYPEYDPDSTISEPTAAAGEIEPDPDAANNGVVVIDSSHLNRFDREDVAPLTRAFKRAGYDVQFYQEGSLRYALEDADAFIVIDPAQPYTTAEAHMMRDFTNKGGRLLVLGEPDRITVSPLGGLSTAESRIGAIEGEYGLHVGTPYVYDMQQENNYKHVVATPTDDADTADAELDDVESVTLFTAAEVTATDGGKPILETQSSARTAERGEQRVHSMAAVEGNVMMIGDTTLVRADRYNVGDNEQFLAYVVEFMVAGDSSYVADPGDDAENESTETEPESIAADNAVRVAARP